MLYIYVDFQALPPDVSSSAENALRWHNFSSFPRKEFPGGAPRPPRTIFISFKQSREDGNSNLCHAWKGEVIHNLVP
jgi:hypothetical protein